MIVFFLICLRLANSFVVFLSTFRDCALKAPHVIAAFYSAHTHTHFLDLLWDHTGLRSNVFVQFQNLRWLKNMKSGNIYSFQEFKKRVLSTFSKSKKSPPWFLRVGCNQCPPFENGFKSSHFFLRKPPRFLKHPKVFRKTHPNTRQPTRCVRVGEK